MELGPNYNLRCEDCGNEVQQPTVPVHGSECFAFTSPTVYCDGPSDARHPVREMAKLTNHPSGRVTA